MSIDVERLDAADADTWNGYVERAPAATPLHRYEALEVLADESGTEPLPLVGYKGQEPVGVFPLFTRELLGVTAAFSPPPSLLIPYLGPAPLNLEKLKRRKRERRHRRFLEACLDRVDEVADPRYVSLRTMPAYPDVRPFQWGEFVATPKHTYHVDLTEDPDDLLSAFSSDARKNVRRGEDVDYDVREGGHAAIERILARVRERYEAQEKDYPLGTGTVCRLYDALPDGAIRPTELRLSGEPAGGIVLFESDDTVYRWQGGAKHDADAPVNDLLDWHVITSAADRGVETYDLVGADEQRLCEYKSKFAPTLAGFHNLERGSPAVRGAAHLYRRFG